VPARSLILVPEPEGLQKSASLPCVRSLGYDDDGCDDDRANPTLVDVAVGARLDRPHELAPLQGHHGPWTDTMLEPVGILSAFGASLHRSQVSTPSRNVCFCAK
jgi:hypothetical protein